MVVNSKLKMRMIPGDENTPWRFILTTLGLVDAAYQFVEMNNWAEREFGSPAPHTRWWVEHGCWHFSRQEDAVLVHLTWC